MSYEYMYFMKLYDKETCKQKSLEKAGLNKIKL